MQKPAPPKLPKPQPQHPHPKPLRRGDTAAPLPPPHAPLASGRPPSPHTPAPAFIRPPGPAPIGKALVEADELPAGSPESSCLGRPIRKPPPGEVRAARDLGSANLPPPGAFSTSRASNVLASYSSNFSATSQTFRLPDPQTLRFPDSQTWLRNRKRPSRAGFWTYTDISNRENQSHECSRPFLIAFPLVRR